VSFAFTFYEFQNCEGVDYLKHREDAQTESPRQHATERHEQRRPELATLSRGNYAQLGRTPDDIQNRGHKK